MENIFAINSKASFIYNERNKHWAITCYDVKGKVLWGKNVGCEEGNKLLLNFCCNHVGYIKCKSLVDTVAICDDDYEYGYVRCHKNNKNRIDKKENLDEWFYTLLIDTLIKIGNRVEINKTCTQIMDYLHFESEANENKYFLSIEDNDNNVQDTLIVYLLDYMKKEKITYARDLGREIVLNHIHIDTCNIRNVIPLIDEIHKLTQMEEMEIYQNFLKSFFGQELLETLEEGSMKLERVKKEDE